MNNEEIVAKVAEHDVRIVNLEGKVENLDSKVDDIHRIASAVEIMTHDMGYIKTDISEVKACQTELKDGQDELREKVIAVENAPDKNKAKLFTTIIEKIVLVVGGGLLAYLLYSLAPNIFSK